MGHPRQAIGRRRLVQAASWKRKAAITPIPGSPGPVRLATAEDPGRTVKKGPVSGAFVSAEPFSSAAPGRHGWRITDQNRAVAARSTARRALTLFGVSPGGGG